MPYELRYLNDRKNKFYNRAGNVPTLNTIRSVYNDCCNLPFYKMTIDHNGNIL
jgi:hypothetical protein